MQRRAAAVYFALFLVISAGAYAYTGVAQKPHVDVEGPSYAEGGQFSVGDRTYTVNAIAETESDGETTFVGNLTWRDSDATYTATLENNTTVSWRTVSWDGQPISTATLDEGSTVRYNGSGHRVALNASASPPTMTLLNESDPSINDTYQVGDTLSLRSGETLVLSGTLTGVSSSQATLSWSDDYRVSIPNTTNPTTVSLEQDFNLTRRLSTDPAVYNTTVTIDGVEYVTYRANDTNRRLATYLPEPEIRTLQQGDTLLYDGNETTVGNISAEAAPLRWSGERVKMVDLAEGGLVLNNQSYLVHFPDAGSVQILENTTATWNTYQEDLDTIANYNERMAGLWGVSILSLLAAVILLGAAYLPVKD